MRFKIGDRVNILQYQFYAADHDATGTVIGDCGDGDILVELDNEISGGHDGHPEDVRLVEGHYGKDGHCRYYHHTTLQRVENEPITIAFDGGITTAKKGGRSVTITCYPDDDDEQGAIMAIKRLYHPFPSKGDKYYVVDGIIGGNFNTRCMDYEDDHIDHLYEKKGNFFRTHKEANEFIKKVEKLFTDRVGKYTKKG